MGLLLAEVGLVAELSCVWMSPFVTITTGRSARTQLLVGSAGPNMSRNIVDKSNINLLLRKAQSVVSVKQPALPLILLFVLLILSGPQQ